MSENLEALTIDVVSDVVCPWCFIGKRRLAAALRLRPEVPVIVNWRPYQLDATIPPEGMARADYMQRKFGSAEKVAEIHARITAVGAAEGIAFAFDRITRSPNTLDAHRLVRWAHGLDKQDQVVEALFRGFFIDGRDLCDRTTLIAIGTECGVDGAMLREFYDTEADIETVQEEIAMAGRLGIRGVPFFIFGGTHAVSGAESPETLANALDQAIAARAEAAAHAAE
jgi:predicted DsbA family dithiol-disulfide isomerase